MDHLAYLYIFTSCSFRFWLFSTEVAPDRHIKPQWVCTCWQSSRPNQTPPGGHLFLPQVCACTCRLRILLGLLTTKRLSHNCARTVERMAYGKLSRSQPKNSPTPHDSRCVECHGGGSGRSGMAWLRNSAAPHWDEP